MSVYPICITKTTMGYTAGRSDKQYHVLCLWNQDGHGVLLNRYGKRGSWGKLLVHNYDDELEARRENRKIIEQKDGHGYRIEAQTTYTCKDSDQLINVLGPQYYYNMGGDALRWLDPDISVSGVKSPESLSPSFKQNKEGLWVPDPSAPSVSVEPEQTPEQIVERQPMWGLF